jgi:peroxiredoxin
MRKLLLAVVLLLLLATALGYLLRQPLKEFAYGLLTQDMFVARDTDDFDPGPALGSRFPGLRASYRGRDITLIEEFAGRNGTVFIASRSLDWCPYCMRQMIQLQQQQKEFEAAGIGLVAMTYDAPQLQQAFIDRHGISIALLSDTDGLSFKTLGILNEQYRRGDSEYGIPHPGMIVVDPQGVVAGKLFLEDYSVRVDAAAALAFSRQVLGIR